MMEFVVFFNVFYSGWIFGSYTAIILLQKRQGIKSVPNQLILILGRLFQVG